MSDEGLVMATFEPDRVYRVVFDVDTGQPVAPMHQLMHGELPWALGKLYEEALWKRGPPGRVEVVELTGIEHVKRARGVRAKVRRKRHG